MVSILIAEDHELARNGLVQLLNSQDDMKVIAQASNGLEAIDLYQSCEPEIVLMDIEMPQLDGVSATLKIKELGKGAKIIMLTSRQEGDEVLAAMAAGADGYCVKDIKIERLVQVIQLIADGGAWLDPAIAKTIRDNLPNHSNDVTSHSDASQKPRQSYNQDLTQRELDVLDQIVKGKSNKEIAIALNITTHTVKTHVCNIIHKLSVDDRTQAAVKALQEGIV